MSGAAVISKSRRGQIERAGCDDFSCSFDLREEVADVQATVLGRIRPEAASRLLELPLAAVLVAAACLVPGDGDMDEALEEIAFLRLRDSPLVFQLLVGLEVRARADQLQAAFIAHVASIGVDRGGC